MYVPPGLITWGGTRPRPTKSIALYVWLSQDSVRRKQIKFVSAILTIEFFIMNRHFGIGLNSFPHDLGKLHWEGSSFWN